MIETKQQTTFSIKTYLVGCGILLVAIICVFFLVTQNYLRSLVVNIGTEEVGVVISAFEPTGYLEEPLTPGNHFIKPWETVTVYKVLKETYSSSSDTNCCEGDSGAVTIDAIDDIVIIANYQIVFTINRNQVTKIHRKWQHRYKSDFVIPETRKVVKEISSEYTSGEIALTKKEEIEQSIFSTLESFFLEEG